MPRQSQHVINPLIPAKALHDHSFDVYLRLLRTTGHLLSAILFVAAAAVSVAAKPESAGPDPDVILQDLYKAHDEQKGLFFDAQHQNLIDHYFTRELAALIRKDAKAADDEMGAVDFDPLYDSQDPQITNFKIGKVKWGGILKGKDDERENGLAVVEATFEDYGEPRSIAYRFHQTAQKTWKIADISYSDGRTIVGILRGDDAGPNGGTSAESDPD